MSILIHRFFELVNVLGRGLIGVPYAKIDNLRHARAACFNSQ